MSPTGTVYASGGGVYTVALADGRTVDASLRGRLKREPRTGSRVVIGDEVTVAQEGDSWSVESVAERRTELVRRGRGGREAKLLAANLDRVFSVLAVLEPPASPELIDRMLVLVESSGMQPTLVLNKVDLEGGEEAAGSFAALYEPIGYRVVPVSARTGKGVDSLREEVCRGTSAFIGPSGAGKSSLLNALDPALSLRIGELSRKTRTGRHTTVGSRLIPLACGGCVADTPGFGDVALWEVDPQEVVRYFPELSPYLDGCRFRGCAHVHEPDCAVRAAVEEGAIAGSRYRSYLKLRGEADEAADPF